MKYRPYGRANIGVSEIGVGGHREGVESRPGLARSARFFIPPRERASVIGRAIERGVTYFDTTFGCEIASLGESLRILGQRDGLFVSGMRVDFFGNLLNDSLKVRPYTRREVESRLREFGFDRNSVDWFNDTDVDWSEDWGGEYGPYMVQRWFSGDSTNANIFYTMSTWNPYDVVVMKSQIGPSATTIPADSGTQTIMPGDSSWNKSSGNWWRTYTEANDNNNTWLTTWYSSDAQVGIMWRFLPRDAYNKQLSFKVSGGHQEVILVDGSASIPVTGTISTIYNNIKAGAYGDVLECTWGHDSNSVFAQQTWKLNPFDSANLKIVIIDKDTATGWNFVGVGPMTLTRK